MPRPTHTDNEGARPMPPSGAAADAGYFAIDHGILRALEARFYMEGGAADGRWSDQDRDCGYFAINGSIAIALKRLPRT
jgi:hypothetical protein